MNMILNDKCIPKMKESKANSSNLIFAVLPYFLSNGGISYNSGKIVSVNKGNWDKPNSREYVLTFTKAWLSECKRVMKYNASIFITGTHHNIFDVGHILKELNFTVINLITWEKLGPPPFIVKINFGLVLKYKLNYDYTFSIDDKGTSDVIKLSSVTLKEKNMRNFQR
ncbi:hypothetical protein KHQ82_00415 [Mycoplasmatota bacterium]|nr:hypothetical protein KHQ82_00415 [Mycoplasmatota bacterium]